MGYNFKGNDHQEISCLEKFKFKKLVALDMSVYEKETFSNKVIKVDPLLVINVWVSS